MKCNNCGGTVVSRPDDLCYECLEKYRETRPQRQADNKAFWSNFRAKGEKANKNPRGPQSGADEPYSSQYAPSLDKVVVCRIGGCGWEGPIRDHQAHRKECHARL